MTILFELVEEKYYWAEYQGSVIPVKYIGLGLRDDFYLFDLFGYEWNCSLTDLTLVGEIGFPPKINK